MAAELEEFKSFKARLVVAVEGNVMAIAGKCQDRGLLEQQAIEAITQSEENLDNANRAQRLLEAVENRIELDAKAYDTFIAILEEPLSGDSANVVSDMKRELQNRRDREQVTECSDAPAKPKPSKMLAATKMEAGAANLTGNGHLAANGGASLCSEGPVQADGGRYAYVGNPPPTRQQQNLDNARTLIQSVSQVRKLRNEIVIQELQQKCDQLENDYHEKELIEMQFFKTCRVLEDLVEAKSEKVAGLQCQLDAMKTRLSGVESLKYDIASEYSALQERMAAMLAEYEGRIEAETNEKNELIQMLEQKQLKIEQSNNDIQKLSGEIQELRQQNLRLVKENCELKVQYGALKLGFKLVLASFVLIAIAIFVVALYASSVGPSKKEEL